MATQIKSNQKAFLAKLTEESKKYHVRLMKGIAENADQIRFRAWRKYMIRAGALGYQKTYTGKRVPKTHKSKLLIRSGRLKGILNSPGKWKIPRTVTQARLRASSKHLLFNIIPQAMPNTWFYVLNMRIMPRGDSKIAARLAHESGRGKGRRGTTPGPNVDNTGKMPVTKGRHPRPFMAPALRDQRFRFERVLFKKLRRSMNKTL